MLPDNVNQPDAGAVIDACEAALEEIRDTLAYPDETIWISEDSYVVSVSYPDDDEARFSAAKLHESLALIRSYRESQPGPWQGIDSAPKDDKQVDLWTDNGRFTDCWWCDERQDWMHWWINDFDRMGPVGLGEHVTHWMPKAPPPAQEGGAA